MTSKQRRGLTQAYYGDTVYSDNDSDSQSFRYTLDEAALEGSREGGLSVKATAGFSASDRSYGLRY